jgi:hypothetical protein
MHIKLYKENQQIGPSVKSGKSMAKETNKKTKESSPVTPYDFVSKN